MDCCAVMRNVPRSQQCSGATVRATAAVSQTNTYCTWLQWCAEIWTLIPLGWLTLYSFSDGLFTPWRCTLCARNVLPFMGCDCLTGRSSMTGSWAEHVTVVERVTTCIQPVSSCHSHVKGLFLSCCAALVARDRVRCTAWVGGAQEGLFWP